MIEKITITANTTLVTHECFKCHIIFAMPQYLDDQAHKDQNVSFYCPNGHGAVYTETENMRLKHKLEQQEAETLKCKSQMEGALFELGKKNKELSRLQKRSHAGVCSECHRTFKQLASHMKSKHSKES